MIILIGLGNPGKKYASTRHNAGRMLAVWLKEEGRRKKEEGEWEIVETDCFMNKSGEWVLSQVQSSKFKVQSLIIAHDDLDLPLGSFKIHFGRGPRLHKGILSIEQALGTKDFWRVRIGVDNRLSVAVAKLVSTGGGAGHNRLTKLVSQTQPPARTINRPSGEEYVLRPFKREEKIILKQTFRSIKSALLEYCIKSSRSRVFSDRII